MLINNSCELLVAHDKTLGLNEWPDTHKKMIHIDLIVCRALVNNKFQLKQLHRRKGNLLKMILS